MSNNIKGITVEIGGNTGPLTAALKDVEKSSRSVQSELKEVNKQLKFNPSSTVLLKQKQELLAKQISNTKEKLETLKDAEKQAEQQFNEGKLGEDKYRALQREVEKTESQLKNLEKQARETGSVLGTHLQEAGTKISSAGDKISGAGQKLLPVTGAIAGIGTAATKMGMDFEKSSAKVSTIADTSQESMSKLESGVMQLSNETGESADDLNEALYQTISAGVKTSDAVGFLGTATKLAKAGFTDSSTAIDALTTTINAYGLKASDAKTISDQLIQTQNLGKTTVADLGGTIGNVIPIAASMNVKTTDLFSSIAELTKNGVKTDEAITGLKGAFSSILSPTKDASKAAKRLGIDFSAAHLKNVGWPKFLEEIKEKTGGNSEEMSKLFGNVRALNAVTILAGKGNQDFTKILGEMGKTAGTTDSAFEKMENNSAAKWEKSLNTMKNAGIKLGEALTPIAAKIAQYLSDLAKKFSALSPAQQEAIIKIAAIVAAAAPALIVIGKMTKGIGKITKGLGKTITAVSDFHKALKGGSSIIGALKLAISPTTLAIVGMVAAIALVAVGVSKLVKYFKSSSIETKKFSSNVSESTQKAVTAFNNLNQKADKDLKELAWTGKTVTKSMANDVKKNIDSMANQTINGFKKQRDDSIKAIQGLATKSSGITKKEMNSMVANVKNGYNVRINSEKGSQSIIDKILQNAADQHRSLTQKEVETITEQKNKMCDNGIKALSKNQLEEKSIYETMKANNTAISAQEAASIVKDSKTTTDKVVGDANKKYKDTVSAIIRERDETHTISADQAKKLIQAAKKTRDDSVKAAEDQHKKVVTAAKKQAGEHAGQVDWETGQVKTKWQAMKDDVVQKAKDMWKNVKTAFGGAKNGVVEKVGDIGEGIKNKWKTLKDDAFNWGKDLIENIKNGIESAKNHLEDAVKGVAHTIKSHLGHSVPTEGPLVDELNWMPDMMDNFAKGIIANKYKVANAINQVAATLKMDKAMPTINSGPQVQTAMAAAYGEYLNSAPINPSSNSAGGTGNTSGKAGNTTINQYFQGKVPSPAETARQTRNGVKEVVRQLRK